MALTSLPSRLKRSSRITFIYPYDADFVGLYETFIEMVNDIVAVDQQPNAMYLDTVDAIFSITTMVELLIHEELYDVGFSEDIYDTCIEAFGTDIADNILDEMVSFLNSDLTPVGMSDILTILRQSGKLVDVYVSEPQNAFMYVIDSTI
jgi:hypothetical protein